jgi:hypothetical protein
LLYSAAKASAGHVDTQHRRFLALLLLLLQVTVTAASSVSSCSSSSTSGSSDAATVAAAATLRVSLLLQARAVHSLVLQFVEASQNSTGSSNRCAAAAVTLQLIKHARTQS